MRQYFIPFHGQVIFRYMDIPYLFIHSSVDGHLGFFPLLGYYEYSYVRFCRDIGFRIFWIYI